MSADISSLVIQVDSTQTTDAAKSLNELTAAAASAEAQVGKLKSSNAGLAMSYKGMEGDKVMAATSEETQKLLDKYDPLTAKLRALKADFDKLDAAAKQSGIAVAQIGQNDAAMASLKTQISGVEAAMNRTDSAARGAAAGSRMVTRELIEMGYEAVSGNFARIPGTFMSLVAYSASFRASLMTVAAAMAYIAVPLAAIGAVAYAFKQNNEELREMHNSLAMTGNAAGTTAAQMRSMGAEIAIASNVSVSEGKAIVQAFVASGRMSKEVIVEIGTLTKDYADATGKTVEEITDKMVKMFRDPLAGAREFAEATNSVTAAEMERISVMVEMGQVTEAQLALEENMRNAIPDHEAQLSSLARTWNSATNAMSDYWTKFKTFVTKNTSNQGQIDFINKNIALLQSSPGANTPQTKERIAEFEAQKKPLEAAVEEDNIGAQNEKMLADQNRADILALNVAKGYSVTAKIDELQRKKTAMIETFAKSWTMGDDKMLGYVNEATQAIDKEIKALEEKGAPKKQKAAPKNDPDEAALNASERALRAVTKEASDYENVLDAITTGSMKNLKAATKEALLDQARLRDVLRDMAKDEKERVAGQKAAEMMKTSVAHLQAGFDKQNNAFDNKDLPDNQRRLALALDAVAEKAAATRQQISQMALAHKDNAAATAGYNAALEDLLIAEQKQLDITRAQWSLEQQQKRDPNYGANKALQKYVDDATNVADQMAAAVSNSFKGMEDALVEFAQTGKLSFKSLADSIIADMTRISVKQYITGPLAEMMKGGGGGGGGGFLGGIFGKLFGGGAAATGAEAMGTGVDYAAALKAVVPGYASGTDYVPKDQMAMIHEGEAVLTKAENKQRKEGGSGGSMTNNVFNLHLPAGTPAETRRAAGVGAREAVAALNAAGRYR